MKTAYIAKQRQISFVKSHFSRQLEERLGLIEVQAPILSRVGDGTQDNLSGCEKAVQVKVKALPDAQFEVVHSLAKWKRQTLGQHDFSAGEGLYTHMKALRPDEDRLSPLHSVYVDQWDWERVMGDGERQFSTLKSTVEAIWAGIKATEAAVSKEFGLAPFLPEQIHFVHSQELLSRYPDLDAKVVNVRSLKSWARYSWWGSAVNSVTVTVMMYARRIMMTGVQRLSWVMPV